jgi:hypothetical protein
MLTCDAELRDASVARRTAEKPFPIDPVRGWGDMFLLQSARELARRQPHTHVTAVFCHGCSCDAQGISERPSSPQSEKCVGSSSGRPKVTGHSW